MRDHRLLDDANTKAVHIELDQIGELFNVTRMRGETPQAFNFRLQVAIAEDIFAREEILSRAISLSDLDSQHKE